MNSNAVEFRAGLADILPAAVAVVPFGLLLGARAVEQGLSVAEVAIMSATVFAGSAQFVAIDIWTHPAPWLVLAFSTLLVNIRHVLMGASLAGKLDAFPNALRPFFLLFMVDEVWAVAERRAIGHRLTPAYYVAMAGLLYINWVGWTVTGAWFGKLVADPEAFGFDFAFTAIFITLVTGFWRGASTAFVLAASSAAAVAAKLAFDGPWYIVAGAVAGIVAAAIASGRDASKPGEG
jgi:4-azaleucine resistance transporter AzlC